MSESQEHEPGLSQSVRQLLNSTLELVENRLELVVVEFQEERIRLIQIAMFLFGVMVCVGMLLMLLTLGVVILFWDKGRWYALGGLGIFYGSIAFVCWHRLSRLLKDQAAFAATLDQFKKDRQWLRRRN